MLGAPRCGVILAAPSKMKGKSVLNSGLLKTLEIAMAQVLSPLSKVSVI